MTRWIATFLIVALVGFVGVASAQTQAPATAPAAGEKMIDGKVKSVDQAKSEVTLEDGTVLTIPAGVPVSWADVKPGAQVAASYTESGQQKSVKKFEVK